MTYTKRIKRTKLDPDLHKLAGSLPVLGKWGTQDAPPGQSTASRLNPDGSTALSRPSYQYPQYPHCTGPANDGNAAKLANNYTCTAP